MASRERKLTEKGQEYQLELKFKALGEAWRSLKSVSEELRLFIAEKRSVREAKALYARWMDSYEVFIQSNDAYCFLLSEDARKEHLDTWFQDKYIWLSNIKSSTEEWFLGKLDGKSAASRRSTSRSKGSSVRLAEEAKKVEELKKMEDLLKAKQAMERKVKMLEIELQHERERVKIGEEIAKSQGRSQLIQEMEEDDEVDSQKLRGEEDDHEVDSQNLQGNQEYDEESMVSKQKHNPEPQYVAAKIPAVANVVNDVKLGEVLLELQKPKLEIKRFDGDCLSFNKFMRQFKSRVENVCNNDEKMAFLEQCTIGEANQIVTGYSFMSADVAYPAALKELSRRYGDVDGQSVKFTNLVDFVELEAWKVNDPV